MKTPMTKLMLAALAATMLCLGAAAATIDLSTLTENFTAQDGDVLTGTAPVNIKLFVSDGATVTLANATHNYATHLGNAGRLVEPTTGRIAGAEGILGNKHSIYAHLL